MSSQRATQLVEAGVWLQATWDVGGARRLFEQALKLDPENSRARQFLGVKATPPVPVPPGMTPRADPRPTLPPVQAAPPRVERTQIYGGAIPQDPAPRPARPKKSGGGKTQIYGGPLPRTPPKGTKAASSAKAASREAEDPDEVRTQPGISGVSRAGYLPVDVKTQPGVPNPLPAEVPPEPKTQPRIAERRTEHLWEVKTQPGFPVSLGPEYRPPGSKAEPAPPAAESPPQSSMPPEAVSVEPVPDVPVPAPPARVEPAAVPLPAPVKAAPVPAPRAEAPGAELLPYELPSESEFRAPLPADVPPPPPVFDPRESVEDPEAGAPRKSGWAFWADAYAPVSVPSPERDVDALDLIYAAHTPPATKQATPSQEMRISDEVAKLLSSARELIHLDDHSGALELIGKAADLDPKNEAAQALREKSEQTLLAMFESRLGSLEQCPKVVLKEDEIIWLNLDHRAGFVLAQIDGSVSYDDLFAICGMSRLDTARILAQLVAEGVIRP